MAEKKNDTKSKILKTAAKLFRDFGYDGTSTRMIADKAKVNVALINYHFRDKSSLYLEVVRFWGDEAFRNFPLKQLNDPSIGPEEKVKLFIENTLLLLFGPAGKGTGLGQLLAREAGVEPSDSIKEIIAETIGEPTAVLSQCVREITGISDEKAIRFYTSCIVGQTTYFFLSRNFIASLFGLPEVKGEKELKELSNWIYSFSMAALRNLREASGKNG